MTGAVMATDTKTPLHGPLAGPAGEALLDRVPDLGFDLAAIETVDLLDAGRRGDVDLGEIVADHVDAHEDEAAFGESRPDRGTDVAVAPGQFRLHGRAAHVQVGPRVARRRNAGDRTRRFAVHQDDAFVAVADFGKVALHDHRLAR